MFSQLAMRRNYEYRQHRQPPQQLQGRSPQGGHRLALAQVPLIPLTRTKLVPEQETPLSVHVLHQQPMLLLLLTA